MQALANDTSGLLCSGLCELMRHVPSLLGAGIDMCIEILRTIAIIGGAAVESASVDEHVIVNTRFHYVSRKIQ
jgi:E3 ubiquitin-protein ligase HUWE1